MDPLMDSLMESQWKSITTATRGDGYQEFRVMRQHKPEGNNAFKYLIQQEDGDPKGVLLKGTKEGMDPLKDVGTCELKLNGEGTEVLGVDLDGDAACRI